MIIFIKSRYWIMSTTYSLFLSLQNKNLTEFPVGGNVTFSTARKSHCSLYDIPFTILARDNDFVVKKILFSPSLHVVYRNGLNSTTCKKKKKNIRYDCWLSLWFHVYILQTSRLMPLRYLRQIKPAETRHH